MSGDFTALGAPDPISFLRQGSVYDIKMERSEILGLVTNIEEGNEDGQDSLQKQDPPARCRPEVRTRISTLNGHQRKIIKLTQALLRVRMDTGPIGIHCPSLAP